MQIQLDAAAEVGEAQDDGTKQVAADLAYKRLAIVNIVMFGVDGSGDGAWTLIDAGIPGTARFIKKAAKKRFGGVGRPAAIVMTHGHVDHVGALETLAQEWDVPIYAHASEVPFLNGQESYPPPDPTVGGGAMTLMTPLFPRGPINVSRWLKVLPASGDVPTMPGWRWIHTPGHTPGHVSLWRESDRSLIAGDAFITTQQESAYAVAVQRAEMHGPPMYFTRDWIAARKSVVALAALEPELAVTGHGRAMAGHKMRAALHELASRFDEVAVPQRSNNVPDQALRS